jgi:hypothetical protein
VDAPLAAERTIVDDRQKLAIWANGERHVVEPPILPYCYAKTPFDEGPVRERQVTRKALSTLEPAEWTKATTRSSSRGTTSSESVERRSPRRTLGGKHSS